LSAINLGQPTFAGLELSDDLQSRYDTAKYGTGLRRARNVLGKVGGGFYSRPGLEYTCSAKVHTERQRRIPFQFSLTQSYVLEFSNLRMRLLYNNGLVARPELIITAATNTNPLTVTIPYNGYLVGWDVVFQGVAGMTQINGRMLRVLAVVGDVVTLDADATGWGVFTGSTGGIMGNANGGTGGEPPAPSPGDPTPDYPDVDPDPPPVVRCVDVNAILPGGKRAGDAAVGDVLVLLSEDGSATYSGVVTAISIAPAPRFLLCTLSGIELTVSDTAPIPVQQPDGRIAYVAARRLRGDEMVAVMDADGLRWEVLTKVKWLPRGDVARISCNDGVYAAGNEFGRYVFTHNIKPPPGGPE
jgi:hypothetical protein